MKQFILLSFMVIIYSYSNAQSGSKTIIGKLADSATGEELTDATIQLMRLKDSVIIRKTLSRKSGFELSRIPVGDYQLSLSFVGYRDTTVLIQVNETDSLINVGVLRMFRRSGDMMEVVIRAVIPPVIVKSDTISYNTEAFKTKPNATVAELLRQLPGMEVDKDGNVTFQGERVQKIYVDGKEFFLNDPKLATNNLLADMIQKVEAFDDKSEKAKRTGIPDNNPGKAINLRLKADKKRGWLGTLESGYASQDRYGIKGTANHFNKDAFTMAVINTSNGGNVQNGSPGLLNNKQSSASLNYRNNFSKNLQVNGEYNFENNEGRNAVSSNRETFFADSSLLQERLSSNTYMNSNHRFNTAMNWTIDTFNIINASASFGIDQSNNSNTSNVATDIKKNATSHHLNNAFTDNQNNSNSIYGNINISYSHIFRKKGRYFGMSVSNGINHNDGKGSLYSLTRFYADSLESNQRSFSDGSSCNIGVGINYTEPVGKNQVLDFGWGINSGTGKTSRHTYNYDPVTGKYDSADSLASNAFKNKNASQQFSLGYNYFKDKWHYQLGLALSKNNQENNNKEGNMRDIKQKATNLFPRASFIYNISKKRNLQLNYSGSTRQPSIYELQPVTDYSNPLLIRLGNPALKQEFSNNISFNYRYFSPARSQSFTWQAEFHNSNNKIVNATTTNAQGMQEQRYVNVQGNYNIGSNISYGLPLGKNRKFGGINTSTRINYGQDVSIANGTENKKRNWVLNQSIGVNHHKDNKLFAGVQAGINWNRASYSIQTFSATNFLLQSYSCNLSYQVFEGIFISSDLNMSFTNSQGSLAGRNAKVWNVAAMKRLLKNKAELKLFVFDVLNNNNSFNQVAGDNYIETSDQEVIKRIFVLSFLYRFTRMGK